MLKKLNLGTTALLLAGFIVSCKSEKDNSGNSNNKPVQTSSSRSTSTRTDTDTSTSRNTSPSKDTSKAADSSAKGSLSYPSTIKTIVRNYCDGKQCHGKGAEYGDYINNPGDLLNANQGNPEKRINKGDMPQDLTMKSADEQKLKDWILTNKS